MLAGTPLKARQDEKTKAIAVTIGRPSRAPPTLPSRLPDGQSKTTDKPPGFSQKPQTQTNPSPTVKSHNVLTIIAAWLVAANAGDAQSTTPESPVVLNTYTVNGSYAGSLEAAALEKQGNSAIVEVIAAEDIGKLPDVSIADALTRLTGLTSQRVLGRDQQITIRGFDPDFSIGTLDGVEQATTNSNRAVEFDQYPSELVGGVTVYKSGQADLVGGLAGTINLETVNPLSVGHPVAAVAAYYNGTAFSELTPGGKRASESYTLSAVNQFDKGTEGIYVGFAHTENPYEGKQFQGSGPYTTLADGNLVSSSDSFLDQSELLVRDSISAVVESKPSNSVHSKLDLFYSYFNDNEVLNGLVVPLYGNATLQPGYTATGGLVTQGTFTHVQPVVDNRDVDYITHMESVVWNLDLGENSSWPIHFSTGYSKAWRSQLVVETYAGLGFNKLATDPDTMVISSASGASLPHVTSSTDYSNASLFYITDPQAYGTGTFPATGQDGYYKSYNTSDVADSYKLTTTHSLNLPILKDVQFGLGISERFKDYNQYPSNYLTNANGLGLAPLPPLEGTTDLSWIGNLHPVAWSALALANSSAMKPVPNPNPSGFEGDDYKVWESIIRPSVKFDLKGNLLGIPFEGNLGGVVDAARQNSNGLSGLGTGSIVTYVTSRAQYADFMPTLNLIFKPTAQDQIRLFAGREEQRPRMYDMRANRDFSYSVANATSTTVSPWGGSSGNPNLRPWMANSIDLDLEHYFPNGNGYIALAGFEKELLSYIYQQGVVTDFTGYPYTSASAPLINTGITNTPVNGTGGHVSGAEATLQLDSAALTGGTLRGIGIVVNGLLVDSTIQPWGPGNGTAPLPDMSKKAANLTLYYESHGFALRVVDHYQSETREYITTFGIASLKKYETPNDGFSEEIPYHTIDAQVSYSFKTGLLKGLSISLETRNLNNSPLVTYYNGDPRQLTNYQAYGATYRLGASYKY